MSTRLLLEGPDLEELLAKIKDEHGPAARIVSAERVRSGGLAGFFAKQRFEIAVDILDPEEAPAGTPEGEPVPATADGLASLLARAEEQERKLDVLDRADRPPVTAARFAQLLADRAPDPAHRAVKPGSPTVPNGRPDAGDERAEAVVRLAERTRRRPAPSAAQDRPVSPPPNRPDRPGTPRPGRPPGAPPETPPAGERPAGPNGTGTRGSGTRGSGARGSGTNGATANGAGAEGYGAEGFDRNGAGTNGAEARGSGTNGAGARGSGPNGAGANGAGANGAGANGAHGAGAHGAHDAGANGAGAHGAGTRDTDANGIGARGAGPRGSHASSGAQDLGAQDLGARELGARELGAQDLGAGDLGARDLGAQDLGAQDLGAGDFGARELGAGGVGANDSGAAGAGGSGRGVADRDRAAVRHVPADLTGMAASRARAASVAAAAKRVGATRPASPAPAGPRSTAPGSARPAAGSAAGTPGSTGRPTALPGPTGLTPAELSASVPDPAEPHPTGPRTAGLTSAGLPATGLDTHGPGSTEPHPTGPHPTGPRPTGPGTAGPGTGGPGTGGFTAAGVVPVAPAAGLAPRSVAGSARPVSPAPTAPTAPAAGMATAPFGTLRQVPPLPPEEDPTYDSPTYDSPGYDDAAEPPTELIALAPATADDEDETRAHVLPRPHATGIAAVPAGHTPNGHTPNGHTPNGHAPNGHAPTRHTPNGRIRHEGARHLATPTPNLATGRATVPPPEPDEPPTAIHALRRVDARPAAGFDHPAVQLVRNGVPVHIAARAVGPDPWSAVARAVAGLPYPPALPSRPGEVLVIVGETEPALTIAGQLAALTSVIDPSATLVAGSIAGTGLRRSHRISGPEEAIRRAAELHTSSGPRVVVVEAAAGPPIGRRLTAVTDPTAPGSPRATIAALHPAQVWACVDASRKNADTARFLDSLERVDALAVYGADATVEPGSVLHFGLPVVMLDGRPATARRWTTLLCERLTGGPLPGDGEGPIPPIAALPAGRRGAHESAPAPERPRPQTHRAPETDHTGHTGRVPAWAPDSYAASPAGIGGAHAVPHGCTPDDRTTPDRNTHDRNAHRAPTDRATNGRVFRGWWPEDGEPGGR
ncbi:hypothetical protein [Cryptosporangium sp. NPDC051539]|uniref:hypothetical protein n=1 Tax=Cryptosporangium sp. NPDC051539 TaxID=3363962 RepID=UPI0037B19289